MSKIYQQYLELKEKDNNFAYVFKLGIFYVFIDEDAKKMNEIIGLKLTHLNESILKCGFPIDSLDKYLQILNEKSIKFKILDQKEIANNYDYLRDKKVTKLLNKIKKEDINKINGIKALNIISELKELL